MPKKHRLTRDELKNFKGKRLQGALFSVMFSPLPHGASKAAVVVPKKVAAKAHDRNLIKRRVRSVFVRSTANGAFLFLAKSTAARSTFAETERDIFDLVARASRS